MIEWTKLAIRPAYRRKARELKRLNALPRYQPASTQLLGEVLELADSASFLFMSREIFEHEIYRFRARSEDPYIIDGGANIGLSILYFKSSYPRSQILAFEPDDQVFAILSRNIQSRGLSDVQLHCRALWSSETELKFIREGADAGRIAHNREVAQKIVRTARLRDYLDRPVDFLKLDVEGAETEILSDCADFLGQVERLFVEYHSFAGAPQTLHLLLNILANAGFRVHIHTAITAAHPFMERQAYLGMDLQLNIFAFRS